MTEVLSKQQKISSWAEICNLYRGIFNNDNKTYLPTKTTKLSYGMIEYIMKYIIPYNNLTLASGKDREIWLSGNCLKP